MPNLAKEAEEFEEIQLAIHSLEFARELSGGIGKRNEELLTDLKNRLRSYDEYKSRVLIDNRMEIARLEQTRARSDKLKIGQTLPQVEALLGKPHEQILISDSSNTGAQLWI